jgi:transposase
MAIIRAIVKGEREPTQLAKLRDANCSRSQQEIAEQLSGHWRQDYLFSLEQSLRMYDAINERIEAYEKEILRRLGELERPESRGQSAAKLQNANKAKKIRERGEEPLHQAWFRMSGVDLVAIDSVGVGVVETVLSEYGPDLSRFPSEKHFVAHLRLAPNRPVTGGKPITGKNKKRGMGSSRVREALRCAVLSLRQSQTALGAYYRHLAQRLGADVAGFATARKVAQYIYRLLRWGHEYLDQGAQAYEQRYQLARIRRIKQQALTLGYELTPKPANP